MIGEPFGEPPVRKARAGEPFGEPAIPEACSSGTSGEPPVRKARAGVFVGSTCSMVGGGRLAFIPKAPAKIIRRSDLEGNFWATFVFGGDDGDSSV